MYRYDSKGGVTVIYTMIRIRIFDGLGKFIGYGRFSSRERPIKGIYLCFIFIRPHFAPEKLHTKPETASGVLYLYRTFIGLYGRWGLFTSKILPFQRLRSPNLHPNLI